MPLFHSTIPPPFTKTSTIQLRFRKKDTASRGSTATNRHTGAVFGREPAATRYSQRESTPKP